MTVAPEVIEALRQIVVGEIDRALANPANENRPEVMGAEETAAFLGVDRKTVYEYAARGKIPCRRLGKRLLFSRRALVVWLAECKSAPHRRGQL